MKKQPLKLVDLVIVVLSVALSLAFLRYYFAHHVRLEAGYPYQLMYDAGAASSALTPITWLMMAVAMSRTPRRRWTLHPAVVVGVSVLVVQIVDVVRFLYPRLLITAAGDVGEVVGIAGNSEEVAGTTIIAGFALAALGGRLHRPRGWLEWSGWLLGLAWIATGICRYVGEASVSATW